jgi:hypothetical protein
MTVRSTRFVSAPALPTRLRSWLTTTAVTEPRSEVSWAYQDAISPTGVGFEARSGLLQPADCQTLLPILLIRTKLALAGKSKAEMKEGMKAAVGNWKMAALEPGAMAYMLSNQGFLNSRCGNCSPHLMFYVAVKDAHTWGAAPLGTDAPVLLAPRFNGDPEPVTEFIAVVPEWSGGMPAVFGGSCSLTSDLDANSCHENELPALEAGGSLR